MMNCTFISLTKGVHVTIATIDSSIDCPLQVLQVDDLKLSDIGPKFEHHEMFPARTNTGNS